MTALNYNKMLVELKKIIQTKNIKTLFQPIVSLKDGEILGYEALSRGPKNTIFYEPDYMFQIAREYDLLWDLEVVCRTNALKRAYDKLNEKKLFVNIDPYIIQDKKFKKGFTNELLDEYGINPHNIIFEITENTPIKDFRQLRNILDYYSQQGYKIALDDAGTGYSGLALLVETHPNFIKVDKEVIREIDKNKIKQDLTAYFLKFSEITNIDIIAEGIETEEELRTLIDLGVQYGQGYLIQKPIESIKPINREIVEKIKYYNKRREELKKGKVEDFIIGDLARKDQPIDITTTIDKVNEIFSYYYTLQGIPVVKADRVVGLVMRNKFYFQLLRRNISDSNNVSIDSVMTKLPLIVDYYAPLRNVIKLAMSRREESIYDYIIVTKEGKYYGVVPINKLIEALSEIND